MLCSIAREQARAGLHDAASVTLLKAIEAALDTESDHRLIDVAECVAQLGDEKAALAIAEAMDDPATQRKCAIARIATAQAKRGDTEAAAKNAAKIKGDRTWHGEALSGIAASQAEAGDLGAARQTAALISQDAAKARSLAKIASYQLRRGDRQAAARVLQEALDAASPIPPVVEGNQEPSDHRPSVLAEIAGVQAEIGMLDDARKTAKTITVPPWKDIAWKRISAAQISQGDSAGSLETANRIQDDFHKGETTKDIIIALAGANDLTTALQVASSIKSSWWRVCALLEIGKIQAQTGQRAAATRTFRDALGLAEQFEDAFMKAGALSNIATAQAIANDDADTQEWIRHQSSGVAKVRSRIGLANGLTRRRLAANNGDPEWSEDDRIPGDVDLFAPKNVAGGDVVRKLVARKTSRTAVADVPETSRAGNKSFAGMIILFGCSYRGDAGTVTIQSLHPEKRSLETVLQLKDGRSILAGRMAPDGRRLAYSVRLPGSDAAQLWLLELNGDARRIADNGIVKAWSPDGARLACSRVRQNEWENFILDIETGKEQQLPIPTTDVLEDWSPEGEVLAVMAGNRDRVFQHPTKGTYALRQLYLVRPDGSGRVELTTDPLLDNIWPRFSPDGRRIAFSVRKHHDGRVLHAAAVCGRDDKETQEIIQFDTLYQGNVAYKANSAPCWSPAGEQFVWLIPRRKTEDSTTHMEVLFGPSNVAVPTRLDLYQNGIRFVSAIDWR